MMAIDLIRELLSAKADALVRGAADDLAALIHPDFVYVNASGVTLDKAGYIQTYCSSGKVVFSEQQFSDLVARQFDGFIVATLIVRDRFSVGGRDVAGTYRSLCVFSNAGERWQWVAGQTMAAG